MSITLEETFARTSKRSFERGTSSFQSQPNERRPSSATLSSGRMMSSNNVNMMNHSLSYTSHNGLDTDALPLPPIYRNPSGNHPNPHHGGAIHAGAPLPQNHTPNRRAPTEPLARSDAILEDQPFHSPHSTPRSKPALQQRANVPPLTKLEPQHIDVSAPSRRCLHKPPGQVMVIGSDQCLQPGSISRWCHSCQMQLWAPKTAIVVRCPKCQTVNSEAISVYMQ